MAPGCVGIAHCSVVRLLTPFLLPSSHHEPGARLESREEEGQSSFAHLHPWLPPLLTDPCSFLPQAEEDKKLKQLMKERDEERQVAELQRLQEEQTGKKKVDKVDWMYATPASGGGIKGEELEDYLLGKRRVDKLLKGDEEKAVRHDPLLSRSRCACASSECCG